MSNRILPLELIDKTIGSPIWILMRGQTEIMERLEAIVSRHDNHLMGGR